ncbi:MAG: hypothetical protein AB8G05_16500 [Oligoflexales bacterium]
MDLEAFLKKWPQYSLAEEQDNSEILEFCRPLSIAGEGLSFQYLRDPCFFTFSRFQGKVFTFVARIEGKIRGIFSLLVRSAYMDQKKVKLGSFSDLLVEPGYSKSVDWYRLAAALMEQKDKINELIGIASFQSVFVDANKRAKRAIYGKKNPGKVCFFNTDPYHMVNIVSPLKRVKYKSGYKVEFGSIKTGEEILDFMDRCQSQQQFGFSARDEWKHRQIHWPSCTIDRFIVLRYLDKIVGVTLPWSPYPAKSILVKKIPKSLGILRKIQKIFPSMNIPKEGDFFKSIYLTHLNICNSLKENQSRYIMTLLIDHVWKNSLYEGIHTVSFADFTKRSLAPSSLYFIQNKIPMRLCYMGFHSHKSPVFNVGRVSALEIAMV